MILDFQKKQHNRIELVTRPAAQQQQQQPQPAVTVRARLMGPNEAPPPASAVQKGGSDSAEPTEKPVVLNANGKPRLRRVACTCPNCKDGDRSRNK